MNKHCALRVAWIGPHAGTELAPCRDAIARDAELVEDGADLIVFACPRPLAETYRLAELVAGDTPVVQLLGVWCEGEERTGRMVDGVERVFWHAWQDWWRHWSEEAKPHEVMTHPSGLVRIDTRDRELAAALIDTLQSQGVAAAWGRTVTSRPAVIVWDGAQLGGVEASRLAAVCQRARQQGSRVVVLLDFPRPETVGAARAIGADTVLGKPFEAEMLLDAVAIEAERAGEPVEPGQILWPMPAAATAQAA